MSSWPEAPGEARERSASGPARCELADHQFPEITRRDGSRRSVGKEGRGPRHTRGPKGPFRRTNRPASLGRRRATIHHATRLARNMSTSQSALRKGVGVQPTQQAFDGRVAASVCLIGPNHPGDHPVTRPKPRPPWVMLGVEYHRPATAPPFDGMTADASHNQPGSTTTTLAAI
jgi:hypothetical protein